MTLLRRRYLDKAIAAELEASQSVFLKPLLEVVHGLVAQLPAVQADAANLRQVLGCLRSAARIFYSLSCLGLTDVRSRLEQCRSVTDCEQPCLVAWWRSGRL